MSRIRSLFNRRSPLVLIIFASRALYRTTSTCNDFVTSNDTDCTVENIAWICKLICRIQIRSAYSADNVQIVLTNRMAPMKWFYIRSLNDQHDFTNSRFRYDLNIIPSIMYYNNQYYLSTYINLVFKHTFLIINV